MYIYLYLFNLLVNEWMLVIDELYLSFKDVKKLFIIVYSNYDPNNLFKIDFAKWNEKINKTHTKLSLSGGVSVSFYFFIIIILA